MNASIKLFRKRLIPAECIELKDDVIVFQNDDMLVTKWVALRPRSDLHHGASLYMLNEGFKISKFCDADSNLLYWYCDIVDYDLSNYPASITSTDLLADVIIYPDGFVKVVDIDELVTCLEQKGLSLEALKKSLLSLDRLLKIIYSGDFCKYTDIIEKHCH